MDRDKDQTIQFKSQQEEIEYWKRLAKQYKQNFEEARAELDEFQVSSHELEIELETQLKQAETRVDDMTIQNSRLKTEVESLRERCTGTTSSFQKKIETLEDELAQLHAHKREMQRYIRELEQSNDNLERSKRTLLSSLEDFETRLNKAIERNAFLESELDEKQELSTVVQRMKDEARDLRHEIVLKQNHDDKIIITKPETPLPSSPISNFTNHNPNTPLTPAARLSALNIVGDLLSKVGALESKLTSCRKYVNPPRSAKSPLHSPRSKRFTKENIATNNQLQQPLTIEYQQSNAIVKMVA